MKPCIHHAIESILNYFENRRYVFANISIHVLFKYLSLVLCKILAIKWWKFFKYATLIHNYKCTQINFNNSIHVNYGINTNQLWLFCNSNIIFVNFLYIIHSVILICVKRNIMSLVIQQVLANHYKKVIKFNMQEKSYNNLQHKF